MVDDQDDADMQEDVPGDEALSQLADVVVPRSDRDDMPEIAQCRGGCSRDHLEVYTQQHNIDGSSDHATEDTSCLSKAQRSCFLDASDVGTVSTASRLRSRLARGMY